MITHICYGYKRFLETLRYLLTLIFIASNTVQNSWNSSKCHILVDLKTSFSFCCLKVSSIDGKISIVDTFIIRTEVPLSLSPLGWKCLYLGSWCGSFWESSISECQMPGASPGLANSQDFRLNRSLHFFLTEPRNVCRYLLYTWCAEHWVRS